MKPSRSRNLLPRRPRRTCRPSYRRASGLAALGAALVALLVSSAADAADAPKPLPVLEARVTRVNDGDSIEVELDSGRARVRFSAIDTPEWDQPYGAQSSAALKA